jgi:hypothetical protein
LRSGRHPAQRLRQLADDLHGRAAAARTQAALAARKSNPFVYETGYVTGGSFAFDIEIFFSKSKYSSTEGLHIARQSKELNQLKTQYCWLLNENGDQ